MKDEFYFGGVQWQVTAMGGIHRGCDGADQVIKVEGEVVDDALIGYLSQSQVRDMVDAKYYWERGNAICESCSIYPGTFPADGFIVVLHVRYD